MKSSGAGREGFIYAALLLFTAAVYWPVVHCRFLNFDDWIYVTTNPYVVQGLTAKGFAWAFHTTTSYNWHPITWLSHMLDCQLFGLNPGAQHLVNVFFHSANTLLLFHLLKRMTREVWPSAMVAALFALHPLHVESVAWIAERKDVLSTFFGLLTIWAYLQYTIGDWRLTRRGFRSEVGERRGEAPDEPLPFLTEPGSRGRSPHPNPFPDSSGFEVQGSRFKVYYWLSLLAFGLGLMSKPMLVTMPFVLLLLDFWPLGRFQSFRVSEFRHANPGVGGAARQIPGFRTPQLLNSQTLKLPGQASVSPAVHRVERGDGICPARRGIGDGLEPGGLLGAAG